MVEQVGETTLPASASAGACPAWCPGPRATAASLPQGTTRARNATDAVGVVLKELRQQSAAGAFRLLVAVDGVNALWGRTTLAKEDRSPVGEPRRPPRLGPEWSQRLGRGGPAIGFLAQDCLRAGGQ